MRYLASKRRRLTGLGMGKDTRELVSFLEDRGFNFKSFSIFMRDICRYMHDNDKVSVCPFLKVDFTGVNTPQCLCSSCCGWRKLLYNKNPSHIANRIYGMFIEAKTSKGAFYDDFMREMFRGTQASLNRLVACIEGFVTAHGFTEDKIHDCHRDCMERSYEIPS